MYTSNVASAVENGIRCDSGGAIRLYALVYFLGNGTTGWASTAACYGQIGFGNSMNNTWPTMGVYLYFANAGAGLVMYGNVRTSSSDSTFATQTAVSHSTWHLVELTIDGTTVEAFLDGVSIGSATKTIMTDNLTPYFAAMKTGGGTSANDYGEFYIDCIGYTQVFSTARW
jgi:hypothetical protein